MNQYKKFFVQTSTPTPSMHQKTYRTQNVLVCKQPTPNQDSGPIKGWLLLECLLCPEQPLYKLLVSAIFVVVSSLWNLINGEQAYAELQTEADPDTAPGVITKEWPENGEIEFVHYTMAYRKDLPPVLNDLSFKVGCPKYS